MPPDACHRRSKVAIPATAIVTALFAAGCQKPLFPETLPRTQYEQYDRMRNRYTPTEQPDVFGNPQPAVRARLGRR